MCTDTAMALTIPLAYQCALGRKRHSSQMAHCPQFTLPVVNAAVLCNEDLFLEKERDESL